MARFLAFLQAHHGGDAGGLAALARLRTGDMRAWMAYETPGVWAHGRLARALSAVKSFVAWAAERDGFDATAVLSVRAPKFTAPCPGR